MKQRRLTSDEQEYLYANPKAIICVETQKLYRSANHASLELGLSYSAINDILRGRRTSPINGCTFEYLERMKGRRF